METNPETISQQNESVHDIQYSVRELSFENSLFNCEPYYNSHPSSVIESRLQDLILDGIEEHCTASNNEDHEFEDFISNRNMALDEHDDNYTIDTEGSFFPLPYIEMGTEAIAVVGKANNTLTLDEKSKILLAKQDDPIYAPASSFEIHRSFTNEEFFMIKLYQYVIKQMFPIILLMMLLICSENAR